MADLITYLTRVSFGEGAIAGLAAEAKAAGITRPLLVTDAGIRAVGLLDQVRDTKEPPQLMFRISQLRYNVARARICGKTGRLDEGREYAKAALLLGGADGIDAFKRKPLDSPLLDPQLRSEMESMASGVCQPSGKQE